MLHQDLRGDAMRTARSRPHKTNALLRAAGACAAFAAASVVSASRAEVPIDAEAAARLRAGEVVLAVEPDETGQADGHIGAVIDIAAAPEKVFAVMIDCERALKFVDHLTHCKVLERSPDGAFDIREHHSRWLSFLPEMVSVFRSDYVPGREIRFSRVRGDLSYLKGSWELKPMAGGKATRLVYDAHVGIGMPVPAFMIRNSLQADVPRLLKSLRQEVLEGP